MCSRSGIGPVDRVEPLVENRKRAHAALERGDELALESGQREPGGVAADCRGVEAALNRFELQHCFDQAVRILPLEEQPRRAGRSADVHDGLQRSTRGKGDHRPTCGHGFDGDDAEVFFLGVNQGSAARIELGQSGVGDTAEEAHVLGRGCLDCLTSRPVSRTISERPSRRNASTASCSFL